MSLQRWLIGIVGFAVALLLLPGGTFADGKPTEPSAPFAAVEQIPGQLVQFDSVDTNSFTRLESPPEARNAARTAVFTMNYDAGFPVGSLQRAAFQAAVDYWAATVTSAVPIVINATWQVAANPNNLGSAGAATMFRDFAGSVPGTWYPVALANKIAGSDLAPAQPDINANFNAGRSDWYLGTDGLTPAGKYDFMTVVIHEIGHGLGFAGLMYNNAGVGGYCQSCVPARPSIYDRFTQNGSGTTLLSLPNDSTQMGTQLTSNNLFFKGTNVSSPARIFAPAGFIRGSSYSHWDEASNPAGSPDSLMTPYLGGAESIHFAGPNTQNLLRDIGWTVASAPPPAGGAMVAYAGCSTNQLARNDDGSSPPTPIGFSANFFGTPFTSLYVNNNGNLTFGSFLDTFTPDPILASGLKIIAAFWADVDTRANPQSAVTTYGITTHNGRPAFCATWNGVGYFDSKSDKLNKFQILLADRGDTGPGNFDIYLNYNQVQWETGDASGGVVGLGGSSARAGYSNGTVSFELPGSAVNGALLDNAGTGLIHNTYGTPPGAPVNGRYVYPVRNGIIAIGGSIAGTVYKLSVDPANAMAGSTVEACRGTLCRTATTNQQGQYFFGGLGIGQYNLRAFPPTGYNLLIGTRGPETIASTIPLIGKDILLLPTGAAPPGTTITNRGIVDGVPSVYWHDPLVLTTQGCPGGIGSYTLVNYGTTVRTGSMVETPPPPGRFVATIPELYPEHGDARITINITCPSGPPILVIFDIYIDPSGFVKTPGGVGIPGVTVTLFRSDDVGGPFNQVPDQSSVMSPANRNNPDLTAADGHFGWDVVAGYYKVRAEKTGCVDPGIPANAFVESAVLTIPPAVTDLDLRLLCTGVAPSITAMSPGVVAAGSPPATLTVTGTGFTASSTITWNGAGLATIFDGPTQLRHTYGSTAVLDPKLVKISVITPGGAGGVSNQRNFLVCPSTFSGGPGAIATQWCGAAVPKAQMTTLDPLASAVFRWSNAGQQFQFWFRGFPDSFNTLDAGLVPGAFYFVQVTASATLSFGSASTFAVAQPGESFTTVSGANEKAWGGAEVPLAGIASALPVGVTAIFQWFNGPGPGAQSFKFWFRGFPDGFQTLSGGLQTASFYFFQASAGGVVVTMP